MILEDTIDTFVPCCTYLISIFRNLDSYSSTFRTDETEDEEVNKEYVEETNRDAVMIAAAKLVAGDAVPKVNMVLLSFKYDFLSLLA